MTASDKSEQPPETEFIVVLRARSSARFLPEEGFELNLEPATAADPPPARLRMFTRWVASGHAEPLPRELVVEVRGREASIDAAIRRFAGIARLMATLAGFVANVRVGPIEVHLAYDCTPESEERQFVEAFLPDEAGEVTEGRIVRVHLMTPASQALLATHPKIQSRLDRALRQYELALREWYVGGEWLALSHLYMAVDALTPAVIRKMMTDRGQTKKVFAQSVGMEVDNPGRPQWAHALEVWCREHVIFDGDNATYMDAKAASDGLEHGSLELTEVFERAIRSAGKTFNYVRKAIVDLMELDPAVASELITIKPKDVQSRRKIIRGRLVGAGKDPAPDEEMYPRLEWSSSIGAISREESTFTIQPKDHFTVRTRTGIGFHMDSIEEVGRLEEGEVPRVLDPKDIEVTPGHPTAARDMLKKVMPIVDAATATGVDVAQVFPRILAFNLFGQGTAFFQGAQTLVETFQPVEALLPLRGLVTIAAHFEQMTKAEGVGVGLAARLAIDSLNREYAEAPDTDGLDQEVLGRAMARRQEWLDAATELGVTMPDEAPAPETSEVWKSLTGEMRLARQVVNTSYVTTGLHVQPGDEPDRMGFRTKLERGHLTDMVATAAAIAELELLKNSATVFGWTIDEAQIEQMLTEARLLNEASANPVPETPVEESESE